MKKYLFIGFILFLLLSLFPICSFAADGIEISGVIDTDSLWSSGNGTYHITGDISVDEGVTLTIEDGCSIVFEGDYLFYIKGKVITNGTLNAPITFTSSFDDARIKCYNNSNFNHTKFDVRIYIIEDNNTFSNCTMNDNMFLDNSCYNKFEFCSFFNATIKLDDFSKYNSFNFCQVEVNNTSAITINAQSSYNKFCNTQITNIGDSLVGDGIYAWGWSSNITVEQCKISNFARALYIGQNSIITKSDFINNDVGITISSTCSISNCNFNNNSYNVKTLATENINISNNYWGSANEQEISAKIYDYYDSLSYGKLIFTPFLSVPYGSDLVNSNYQSGEYNTEISIELSVSNDSDIYYTLDGSDPKTNGIKYKNPILISKNTTILCVSYINNTYSEITTYEYKVNCPDNDYTIKELYISNIYGEKIENGTTIPETNKFCVNASVTKNTSAAEKGYLFIATYTDAGQLIDFNIMSGTYYQNQEITFISTINNPDGKIGKIKAFVWDSLTSLTPLSNSLCID